MSNSNSAFKLGITSSFIGEDSSNLVTGVLKEVEAGRIPARVLCVVSTREIGEDDVTDFNLKSLRSYEIPVISVSAKKAGRIGDQSNEGKTAYDLQIMRAIEKECGQLPTAVIMLGDMIIHSALWCKKISSLNLHPDLPLKMGGFEGIYWDVIGKWILQNRKEAGGMIHLATPELDAGTAVAYFRIPLKGVVNGVDLGRLWETLPEESDLVDLVSEQTQLRDKPSHPLFQELRHSEAMFESELVNQTLIALAEGRINIRDGKVVDDKGTSIIGLDLTSEIVGKRAIWDKEGNGKRERSN